MQKRQIHSPTLCFLTVGSSAVEKPSASPMSFNMYMIIRCLLQRHIMAFRSGKEFKRVFNIETNVKMWVLSPSAILEE